MGLAKFKKFLGLAYHKIYGRKTFLESFTPLHTRNNKKGGLFTLSFDCDTDQDMEQIPLLLEILEKYEVKASFALCGELVEKFSSQSRKLVNCGHEVINHGYTKHCKKNQKGSWYSHFFYNELSRGQIKEEITRNHLVIKEHLKVNMKGWRTPHFGTFCQPENLRALYDILAEAGYIYSTSTCSGQITTDEQSKIYEIPLTCCPWHPGAPFDSWHLLKAPDREHRNEDLIYLFSAMNKWLQDLYESYLLNIYFDPAHIMGVTSLFEKFLQSCRENSLFTLTYSDIPEVIDIRSPENCMKEERM